MTQIRRIFEKIDEKKEQKKKRWAGIIIVAIMLLSTAAFALLENSGNNTENQQKYKEYTFLRTDEGWQTTVNNNALTTLFLPQEVENISSSAFISGDLGNAIYLIANTYDEKRAASELFKALSAQRAQHACLPEDENKSECADWPLKSCSDATSESGIVIIKESNETSASVNYENFCLRIAGNVTELTRAADNAVFRIMGII